MGRGEYGCFVLFVFQKPGIDKQNSTDQEKKRGSGKQATASLVFLSLGGFCTPSAVYLSGDLRTRFLAFKSGCSEKQLDDMERTWNLEPECLSPGPASFPH